MLPLALHFTFSQFALSLLSAQQMYPATCILPVFAWLVFMAGASLRGLSTHAFNNTDGLRHQVLIDIEPAFPPEHLPLTLEGMT